MRLLLPVIVICVILSVITGITVATNSKPQTAAKEFLQAVKGGHKDKIVDLFGNNTCACQPKGGWISYLNYESGESSNLASLVGRPFQLGILKRIDLPDNQSYLIPWQRPESTYIDVPLSFSATEYQPFFLPINLAFGKNMSWKDVQSFAKNPLPDAGKGFCLRLRPNLVQGLISPPAKDLVSAASKKVAKETKPSKAAKTSKPAATASATIDSAANDYKYPVDAGRVLFPNGRPATSGQVEATLPRLKQAIIRLKVVRRGQLDRWQISKFKFENAVFSAGGKDYPIALKDKGAPDNDL